MMQYRTQSVVHITEAFASGTLEAMRRIISAQHAEGADVTVLHAVRQDSPPPLDWDNLFPAGVVRRHIRSGIRIWDLWLMAKAARKILRQDPFVILHVHSTYAAAAVRLLLAFQTTNRRVVYSPHGFSFLRQDLPTPIRTALLVAEKFLARQCGALMLVSESEAQLVKSWLPTERISVVENAVYLDEMRVVDRSSRRSVESHRPVVATMGRVTYQKAPWKFAELARSLGGLADFIWIGDGLTADRTKWLDDAPVHVTGWLPRHEVVSELQSANLFVLPSLWEGMPLALIEAQCLGLPAVASNIVGNKDVVIDAETGYLVEDDDELLDRVTALISDASLRQRMRMNALDRRMRFSHERLGKETLDIYERLLDER